MTRARVRPLVTKEIRALLPVWIASVVAIGAAVLSGDRNHELGLVAYGLGSAALGAQSIGHEYTHRTLTLLLSQPSTRRRLLLMKLGVLAPMLLMLTTFAWLTLLKPDELTWVFVSLLNGICLAPLLTMVSRTPIAGVVFTGAAPFWMLVISRHVGAGVLLGSTLAVSIVAAVASWRLFMRLGAIDGRGPELRLPRLWRRAIVDAPAHSARARHPVWLLVKKELHLQQMTFAVAGVWAVIWLGESALTRMIPGFVGLPLPTVSIAFGGLLALLIGSLASAEERQIGTLEWQQLLPMSAWKQWAVKAGTALGLAAVMSFALPELLATGHVGANPWHFGVIVILTTSALYVSSLCGSSLRALMVSGPAMFVVSTIMLRAESLFNRPPSALIAVPIAGVVALMLWFAFENHRLARQGAGRIVQQAAWIAGGLAIGVAIAA